MPWVFLDDGFHSNPKILAAGDRAAGLYARMLSYCGDQLTDGFIPDVWMKRNSVVAQRSSLERERLVKRVKGGYLIPDYLEHNLSKEKIEEKRRISRETSRRHYDRKKGSDSRSDVSGDTSSTRESDTVTDTTPLPSPRSEVIQLPQRRGEAGDEITTLGDLAAVIDITEAPRKKQNPDQRYRSGDMTAEYTGVTWKRGTAGGRYVWDALGIDRPEVGVEWPPAPGEKAWRKPTNAEIVAERRRRAA